MRNALTVGTCAILLVTGCSGGTSAAPPAPTAAGTAPVIAPGRPGEEARTLSPSEAATAVPPEKANAADIRYMQNMIIHHRQALDMSLLAASRAANDGVKRLASRINQVQGPEIAMMTDWLKAQGQQVPDHHAGHEGMPGMATPEQLASLEAAKGPAFDQPVHRADDRPSPGRDHHVDRGHHQGLARAGPGDRRGHLGEPGGGDQPPLEAHCGARSRRARSAGSPPARR